MIIEDRERYLQALLRTTRLDSGLTQAGLADRLNKPQSFVSKYENGERELSIIELEDVCIALGISLSNFVEKYESGASDSV